MNGQASRAVGRREFLAWASQRGLLLGVAGVSLPSLLAACGGDEQPAQGGGGATPDTSAARRGKPIVGDVLDHALSSEEWSGAFGFVTLRLHRGAVDGKDVWFIRTDTSDKAYADRERLVWAPKLATLLRGNLAGDAYLVSGGLDDQPMVLSSQPGRADYTPAWRLHRAAWKRQPRPLGSVAQVLAARRAGRLQVTRTDIVLNAAVVKWPSGAMPVDDERAEYLGPGQLLEAPDTSGMTVTFKLHECFPGVRYIVTDTSMAPMATGMHIAHSPRLQAASKAGATGRTNVFGNGVEGSGPMGFQPSVFDTQAGNPAWSPYWDHMTYTWKDGNSPRVLTTETEVHAARDAGELQEFRGSPDTKGALFVVNCQVPVLAPNTFAP
jgi:hypothetical protein